MPRRALLGLAVGLAAGAAAAQEPTGRTDVPAPPASGDTVYLSPLVTDAEQQDPYTEPAAKSTIGSDAIDLFGGQNLDDALRLTPGTFTRDSPQNPGIAVDIRGLEGSGRVAMAIDGVRQNFRFTGHEAQGFTYVDPALLAGIDVSRGAVAGAGGAGALAGAANFRTIAPADVLRDGANAGGFVGASWGDNGSGFAPVAAGALRSGAWSFLAAASGRSPGDYENGKGQRVAYTGQNLRSGLLKLEFRPDDAQRLALGGVFYDNDFTANSYTQNVDSKQFTANYAWTPSGDAVDLRVNAYRSDVRMTYDTSPTLPDGGSGAGRRIEDSGTGFDANNTTRFGEHVSSNYGVAYFHDDVDTINSTAAPGFGVNPSGENSIASAFSDTKLHYGITDTVLGLRYDRYGVEGSGSITAGNPLGMPAGPYAVDRSGGAFNPSLTFAIAPLDWLQPYLRWSRTFRPPTVSETLMGGDHPADGGPRQVFYPNPFLKPETSRGWELGVNVGKDGLLRDDDKLRAKATYYRNSVDDYVTAMFGPSGGAFFGNNAGTSIVEGVEFEGGYDAGFAFANLSFSHTDSDLQSQVNGLGAQSYLPNEVYGATLGARLVERRLTLGARWSKVTRSFIGEENAYGANKPWEPGYDLVDLFANYAFGNGLELRANLANAGNTVYTPVLSTPAAGNSVETGRGRTWSLTAKYTF